MLANLAIGLALWTLGSAALALIAARALTFSVREDQPVRRQQRHVLL